MTPKLFARNLRYLLKKRKLKIEDLAVHMGVKPTRFNAWLEGRAFPRIPQLIDLCDALGFDNIYQMITVDLQKQKVETKEDPVPANVAIALKRIIETASGALT